MTIAMTTSRLGILLSATLACAACGSNATSFRTIDRGDDVDRAGPPAASYEIILDERPVAKVHVWSNGGYVNTSDTPMTHIGFEIRNVSSQSLWFDVDALQLTVYDNTSSALPPARLSAISPFGPPGIVIASGRTVMLATYFSIPVPPRVVDHMQIQWIVQGGDLRSSQTTSFVRDDDAGIADSDVPRMPDPPRAPAPQPARS